jgi:hypothetical protein
MMATLEHTPTSTEKDVIEGDYDNKARLTHTISSGAVSMSPELFEKVRRQRPASSMDSDTDSRR